MEPVKIESYDQLANIMPEQFMDDDQFFAGVATGDLHVLQSYERKTKEKTLLIVYDVSPSMNEKMKAGHSRHAWCRGIILNLMNKAVTGEATFLLLPFATNTGNLNKVLSPEDGERAIYDLLYNYKEGSGTNILGAIKTASERAKDHMNSEDGADILLITDGEDRSLSETGLRTLLGDSIRLHVVILGEPSIVLQAVATTYKSF
jgi:uncharacterized protein with von Willebrand factor type A (vWA) domain